MKHIDTLISRYPVLVPLRESIVQAVKMIEDMHFSGGKLLLCGNGGSAADCEHISGELLKSFLLPRPQHINGFENLQGGIAAIPLPSLSALISAFSNDVAPELVYAQLTNVLAVENDVLFCISTSGNSKNVVLAAHLAKIKNIKTIALTGRDGGELKQLCTACICVPETETFKVQELHLPVYHAICAQCEEDIFR